MSLRYLLSIVILVLTLSCQDQDGIQVNLDSFEQITEQYPYTNLKPTLAPEYWELNYTFYETEVVISSGTKCLAAEDPEQCNTEFESVEIGPGGFARGCLPDYCHYFIKYQKEGQTHVVKTETEVKGFLGEIDSESDAILLAFSEGYHFSIDEKKIGGIKETSSGYQLIVTKLVSGCTPLQVDRFLLQVNRDGSIKILEKEKYSYYKNGCV